MEPQKNINKQKRLVTLTIFILTLFLSVNLLSQNLNVSDSLLIGDTITYDQARIIEKALIEQDFQHNYKCECDISSLNNASDRRYIIVSVATNLGANIDLTARNNTTEIKYSQIFVYYKNYYKTEIFIFCALQ